MLFGRATAMYQNFNNLTYSPRSRCTSCRVLRWALRGFKNDRNCQFLCEVSQSRNRFFKISLYSPNFHHRHVTFGGEKQLCNKSRLVLPFPDSPPPSPRPPRPHSPPRGSDRADVCQRLRPRTNRQGRKRAPRIPAIVPFERNCDINDMKMNLMEVTIALAIQTEPVIDQALIA